MDEPGPSVAMLQRFLSEHDAPCPACGYNLRGLTSASCPECNSELILRIGLVEPRLGAYVTGLVGWSMGAGLNALLLLYLGIILGFFPTSGVPPKVFLLHNLLAGALQGAGLAAWIVFGRRIRRLDAATRWGLAMVGWGASLINVVLFAYWVK
jgi:hypothetical protein